MRTFLNRAALLALCLAVGRHLTAADIHVFAAASLSESLKAIATDYEQRSTDHIVFNFGASSTLARQIEEGAPADIFFSADEAKMDVLEKRDRIAKETRKSRLSNSMVIVVSADSSLDIASARDLADPRIERLALADPRAVPAGIYAKGYLEKLQVWTAVKAKVVPVDNVRGALAAVESGNVEAGIVYKTDAAISKKVKVSYEVPAAAAPAISYPMALVKDARQPEAARKFLKFLDSREAGRVFERFGFVVRD